MLVPIGLSDLCRAADHFQRKDTRPLVLTDSPADYLHTNLVKSVPLAHLSAVFQLVLDQRCPDALIRTKMIKELETELSEREADVNRIFDRMKISRFPYFHCSVHPSRIDGSENRRAWPPLSSYLFCRKKEHVTFICISLAELLPRWTRKWLEFRPLNGTFTHCIGRDLLCTPDYYVEDLRNRIEGMTFKIANAGIAHESGHTEEPYFYSQLEHWWPNLSRMGKVGVLVYALYETLKDGFQIAYDKAWDSSWRFGSALVVGSCVLVVCQLAYWHFRRRREYQQDAKLTRAGYGPDFIDDLKNQIRFEKVPGKVTRCESLFKYVGQLFNDYPTHQQRIDRIQAQLKDQERQAAKLKARRVVGRKR